MTVNDFAAPATGGVAAPADLDGRLLVVEVVKYVESVTTAHGDKDAIAVTVHDIDGAATHTDVLWFAGRLIGALKSRTGSRVLARMGKGTARPGMAPPWVLLDATSDQEAVAKARAYLAALTPATPAAAPAPAAGGLESALAAFDDAPGF